MIACYQTLCKIKGKTIGLLIADEADTGLTNIHKTFFYDNKFDMFLGLSATMNTMKFFIASSIAPVAVNYSLKQAQSDGLINKIKIIIHEVPLSEINDIKLSKGGFWSELTSYKWIDNKINEIKEKIAVLNTKFLENLSFIESVKVNNEIKKLKNQKEFFESSPKNRMNRMEFIYGLESLTKYAIKLKDKILQDEKNKLIVFARRTKILDKICGNNTYYGNTKDNTNIEDFNLNKIKLIGAAQKVERGISFENLNNCISHSFSSSESTFIQSLLGRLTRLNTSETAYLHILISYYYVKENNINVKKYCQNKVWLDSILEKTNIDYEFYKEN